MLDRTQVYPLPDAYLAGEFPLYVLRGRFYSGDIVTTDEVEVGIYRAVSMHLAMYTAGTRPEEELKAAIRWHVVDQAGENVQPPIPMLDKQWMEMMSSGLAPWPRKIEVVEKITEE